MTDRTDRPAQLTVAALQMVSTPDVVRDTDKLAIAEPYQDGPRSSASSSTPRGVTGFG